MAFIELLNTNVMCARKVVQTILVKSVLIGVQSKGVMTTIISPQNTGVKCVEKLMQITSLETVPRGVLPVARNWKRFPTVCGRKVPLKDVRISTQRLNMSVGCVKQSVQITSPETVPKGYKYLTSVVHIASLKLVLTHVRTVTSNQCPDKNESGSLRFDQIKLLSSNESTLLRA